MTPEQIINASPWFVGIYSLLVVGVTFYSLYLAYRQATVKADTKRMADCLERIEVKIDNAGRKKREFQETNREP